MKKAATRKDDRFKKHTTLYEIFNLTVFFTTSTLSTGSSTSSPMDRLLISTTFDERKKVIPLNSSERMTTPLSKMFLMTPLNL